MREILLFSGGIDSFVAWFKLNRPKCLHFASVSRYSWKEDMVVRKLEMRLNMDVKTIPLPFMKVEEREDAWIPGRNFAFVVIASYFGDVIYLPCQRGERDIEDRSDKFFEDVSRELSFHWRREKLVDPVWRDETKQDIIRWYIDNVGDMDLLRDNTVSCYDKDKWRCGRCAACFRLAVALEYNNVDISGWFYSDPFKWEGVSGYLEKIRRGEYEQRRSQQTLEVLSRVGIC